MMSHCKIKGPQGTRHRQKTLRSPTRLCQERVRVSSPEEPEPSQHAQEAFQAHIGDLVNKIHSTASSLTGCRGEEAR